MKFPGVVLLLLINTLVIGQNRPKPFELARKAIASIENEAAILDSVKRRYNGRWLIDFRYGQRFVAAANKTGQPDIITKTDFTEKRGFFGFGSSYFLTDHLLIAAAFNFLILPKKQDINSFSGSGGSGTGSGGLSFDFELSGRYYFSGWDHTRPYISTGFGRYQLVAKGGRVDFSLSSGRNDDIQELNVQLVSASISTGVSHRMAPGTMLDVKIGYAVTDKTVPIGGITSPGGLNTSLALQFILNPKKK